MQSIRTPLEHLNNICTILNRPISQISNICNISRQIVYKWLAQNERPDSNNIKYICTLSYVADEFKKAGVMRFSSLLTVRAFNGLSIMDIIKAGRSYREPLKRLIKEARLIEDAYNRSGLGFLQKETYKDWKSIFVVFN